MSGSPSYASRCSRRAGAAAVGTERGRAACWARSGVLGHMCGWCTACGSGSAAAGAVQRLLGRPARWFAKQGGASRAGCSILRGRRRGGLRAAAAAGGPRQRRCRRRGGPRPSLPAPPSRPRPPAGADRDDHVCGQGARVAQVGAGAVGAHRGGPALLHLRVVRGASAGGGRNGSGTARFAGTARPPLRGTAECVRWAARAAIGRC